MAKLKNFILLFLIFTSIIFLLLNPKTVSSGAIKGLLICGEIIIPSLFVFSVIGIFLVYSNCTDAICNLITPFSKFVFGMNGKLFIIFLISLISGYPIGAKLINELVKEKNISEETANKMLCFCVNAGPSFIILAVGEKIFQSKTLGLILFVSHIFASVILALFSRGRLKDNLDIKTKTRPLSEAVVSSVNEATQVIFSICAFVILFSVIFEIFGKYNLKIFLPFLEVTVGIISTRNLFFASFLLGFSGISVQLQILSIIKNFKVNKIRFFVFRILHGTISTTITFLIVKILKISVSVFSNNKAFTLSPTNLTLSASICFLLTGIVFVSSLKKASIQ